MGYAFRFYGRAPFQWKGTPEFSVQFARELTSDEKRDLGRDFVTTATGTAVHLHEVGIRWSGRFMQAIFGLRWERGLGHVGVFTDFLMLARHYAPIIDVVNVCAEGDGSSRWDRWSLEQGPPDPGPKGSGRLLDARAAELRADASFDAGFADALGAADRKKLDVALANAAPDAVGLVVTEATQTDEGPPPPTWGPDVEGLFERAVPPTELVPTGNTHRIKTRAGDHLAVRGARSDVPIALVYDEAEQLVDVAVIAEHDGQRARALVTWEPARSKRILPMIASDESGAAVFVATEDAIFRLDREGACMRAVWTATHAHPTILAIAWLGDARLLCLTPKKLVVLDVSGDGVAREVAQSANAGGRAGLRVSHAMTPTGAVIVTSTWGQPSIVSLFAHDELRKVGEFPKSVWPAAGPGGQVLFRSRDTAYAVTNLDAVLATFRPVNEASAARTIAANTPSAKKRATPALVPCPSPPAPTAARAPDARFPPESLVVHAERGDGTAHALVLTIEPPKLTKIYPEVRVGVLDGDRLQLHDVTPALGAGFKNATGACISVDGGWGVILSFYEAWHLDLVRREAVPLWRGGSGDASVAAVCVDEAQTLLLSQKGLSLMRRSESGWELAHTLKVSKPERLLWVARHGYGVVQTKATTRALAFTVVAGKVKKLAEDKTAPITSAQVVGDEVILIGPGDHAWRFDGIVDASRA